MIRPSDIVSAFAVTGGLLYVACATIKHWNEPIANLPELSIVLLLIAIVFHQLTNLK